MSATASPRLDLEDDELLHITGKKQPAAQARFLAAMRVPFTRRKDGTLLVGRAAMEAAMLGHHAPARPPVSAGIQWKVHK